MEHPITPPPMLRRLWAQQAQRMDPYDPVALIEHVANQAARWGDEQRLKACLQLLDINGCPNEWLDMLRAAMRPKPPSLAEEAFDAAKEMSDCMRAALERLKELEDTNG